MGLRDLLGEKKKTREVSAPVQVKKKRLSREESRERAKDRLAAEKAREELRELRQRREYIDELRKKDPARYAAIMERKLGLTEPETKGKKDRLDEYLAMRDKLKEAGFDPEGDEAGNKGLIKDILQALPVLPSLINMMQGQPIAAPQVSSNQTPQSPQGESPAGGQPFVATPPPAVQPMSQKLEQQAAPQPAATEPASEGDVSVISAFLINQLTGKTAHQAAQWFLSQNNEQGQRIIEAFRAVPDDQLPALLEGMVQSNPSITDFHEWLKGRWQWFVDIVQIIKRTGGQ